jgi:flavin-dependent thymidylate synthase
MTDLQFRSDFTTDLVDQMGDDDSVLRAMLISTLKDSAVEDMTAEAKAGRINFLMRGRHGTPFEHNALTFRSEAPIFVYREWHRHRIGVCIAGDSFIDFVDINGMRAPKICKTIEDLWRHWEHGEINGHATDAERLSEALDLVAAGVSVRKASAKTGIARGTIDRHRNGVIPALGRRGGRWRVEGMRIRVLDESTGRFTHSTIQDVIRSGVKEVISLDIGRTLVKVTPDHLVWTPDGWRQAGSLRKGDHIARPGKVAKYERQIPPRLRQGIGLWTEYMRDELIQDEDVCYVCLRTFPKKRLVLDHIVPVVSDLSLALTPNNLAPCCEPCHRKKTNSEQALAVRGTIIGTRFEELICDPRSSGRTMTYDLSVAGHHNFVANGIVVHNSINEQSGRYVELPSMFYIPPPERALMQVGKPGAYEYVEAIPELYSTLIRSMKHCCKVSYRGYQLALENGIAKEVARMVLPVNIYSSMYWTCNARSLMAFLSLRTRADDYWIKDESLGDTEPGPFYFQNPGGAMFPSKPMWEIEACARAMEQVFSMAFPLTYEAFVKHGRVAP